MAFGNEGPAAKLTASEGSILAAGVYWLLGDTAN